MFKPYSFALQLYLKSYPSCSASAMKTITKLDSILDIILFKFDYICVCVIKFEWDFESDIAISNLYELNCHH